MTVTTSVDEGAAGELLVILRHGPHSGIALKEGLDAALVAAAFGRRVSLLFMGSGVAALMPGQGKGPLDQKGTLPTLDMLEMYDIDRCYADVASLEALDMSADALVIDVTAVDSGGVAQLMACHSLVMTF